uniref:Uncharacterized protein n=1 Tax=Romanomermis culicivorax TaxID=13658 RepID=A0A915IDP3_ROMCU
KDTETKRTLVREKLFNKDSLEGVNVDGEPLPPVDVIPLTSPRDGSLATASVKDINSQGTVSNSSAASVESAVNSVNVG